MPPSFFRTQRASEIALLFLLLGPFVPIYPYRPLYTALPRLATMDFSAQGPASVMVSVSATQRRLKPRWDRGAMTLRPPRQRTGPLEGGTRGGWTRWTVFFMMALTEHLVCAPVGQLSTQTFQCGMPQVSVPWHVVSAPRIWEDCGR
jgi:hypothetical protein